MAITVSLPANSPFTITDVPEFVDFISTEASVTLNSAMEFSGFGTYNGQIATYIATGSGFATSTLLGSTYISAGIIETVRLTTGGDIFEVQNIDIDMAIFAPIVISDLTGVAPFAIEDFMMARDWEITLGDLADVAPKGILVGDGATLNPIGEDIWFGRGGDDNLFTGDGDDRLYGNKGNDILNGGTGRDRLEGGQGKDKLNGEKGSDRLFGGDGNDGLKGAKGNDTLNGGKGRDVIDGGEGNDKLFGNAGYDRFVFRDGSGSDRIFDFSRNNKEDIDLRAVTAITDYADLVANHISDVGGDVLIDDGAGTEITLIGLQVADLNKGDFLF